MERQAPYVISISYIIQHKNYFIYLLQIIRTLRDFYGYECNIDDILKAEINNVAQENITNVRAHFINNNEAVEASEILR